LPNNDANDRLSARDPIERAAAVATIGLQGTASVAVYERLAAMVEADIDQRVRATALAALARHDRGTGVATGAWHHAIADPDPGVRRRATEVAPQLSGARPLVAHALIGAIRDAEPLVAESAAWALGELESDAVAAGAVAPLMEAATEHRDALVREAAVAALGALGDATALPAILAACDDKPAIRRRAVLALAPFDGPEVDAAIERARADRDWQVRQAAETVGDG
jgi:hypothetical protein